MAGVTRFITGQEPTQEHEFAIFISLIWSLLQNKKKNKNRKSDKIKFKSKLQEIYWLCVTSANDMQD